MKQDPPTFPSINFGPDRKALRPQEVAAKLDITVRHVYDLIDEGQLRAINCTGATKANRRYARIPVEAFEAYVRAHTL
jgi:excisionase family DNA binding protein